MLLLKAVVTVLKRFDRCGEAGYRSYKASVATVKPWYVSCKACDWWLEACRQRFYHAGDVLWKPFAPMLNIGYDHLNTANLHVNLEILRLEGLILLLIRHLMRLNKFTKAVKSFNQSNRGVCNHPISLSSFVCCRYRIGAWRWWGNRSTTVQLYRSV